MKKTYSITCEPELMAQIDETANGLGMNRSSYLTWVGLTISKLAESDESISNQLAYVFTSFLSVSSLTDTKK